MIVAITGDRDWCLAHYELVRDALALLDPEKDFVVLGDARGVDALAEQACKELELPYERYKADWHKYGPAAGPIRNGWMLDHQQDGHPVDTVWAFHDDLPNSKGTKNMVSQAEKRDLIIHRFTTDGWPIPS